MRKIYLFIAALVCSIISAWADNNTVYLQNMQFDVNSCTFTFNDTYQSGVKLDREYHIRAYKLTDGEVKNYVTDEVKRKVSAGLWADFAAHFIVVKSTGGNISSFQKQWAHTIQSSVENFLYAQGILDVRFIIDPYYSTEGEGYLTSYYGPYVTTNNNFVDVSLPRIWNNSLSAPARVNHGDQMVIESTVRAIDKCQYYIQESNDGGASWTTRKSGSLNTAEAREGTTVTYKRIITGNHENILFRTRVVAFEDPYGYIHNDTSAIDTVRVFYPCSLNGKVTWCQAGYHFNYSKPMDCREYRYTSALPVKVQEKEAYLTMIMPACPVIIEETTPTYTVTYLNADYSWLDKVEVECGDDATNLGPTKPEYGDYTFIGWNKDLTNIHSNMTVVAKYDIGSNYWLSAAVTDHKNEVFPFEGFANSETRAMVGDKMTFTADVFATAPCALYYETAQWSAADSAFNWLPNSGKKVADYEDANKERWFDQEITICYDDNTSYIHPFEYKVGVRFYLVLGGSKAYSEPIEIDVYYPLTINSNTGDAVFAENNAGDYIQDLTAVLPARYNDTVRVISINGAEGGCLDFERQSFPERPLYSGTDDNDKAYFICPGEKEAINVSVSKVAVVFDGVYPTQLFDFTAEGLGKHTAYYAEVVNCGGCVQNMPEDPTDEGYIFTGWKAWLDDYADDDYLHVPSGVGNAIGFAAQWEEIAPPDTFDVKFYEKDGITQIGETQRVAEGEDAVPPTAPEVSGYHFVCWDEPYTTITANTDIVAIYGKDATTWTVTYKNWNDTVLTTEIVNDGEAAQGVVATREGYSFTGWSEDISHVTSDMTVTAQFTDASYVITYVYRYDGENLMEIAKENVKKGEMPVLWASLESAFKYDVETELGADKFELTVLGWAPEITAATKDATYELLWSYGLRKFNVRFQDWDHTFLNEQKVEYGKAAQAPNDPTREGYTFKGWDRDFSDVRADLTVTAVFEKANGEQGIESIQPSVDSIQKVLLDGSLYITTPEGRIFNAQGMRIR